MIGTINLGANGEAVATELDIQALVWALGILAVPVLTAIPLRFIWQYWIGGSHEESEYRTNVRQIIDSGRQLESYRNSLNDVARSLRITPSRQRLIEADIFIVEAALRPKGIINVKVATLRTI